MTAPLSYLRYHGPMLRQFCRIAVATLVPPRGNRVELPTQKVVQTVEPLPNELIDAFIRYCGGDPKTYRSVLPPALFPQWAMPLMAKTLLGLPYPFVRIVNAGATMQINASLPRDEPLRVSARLMRIDENERRVIFEYETVTETVRAERALVASIQAIIKKPRKKNRDSATQNSAPRKEQIVPHKAKALKSHPFDRRAGADFALITGDMNPVHWLLPYARALGYKRPILHGFATFACATEALVEQLLGTDPAQLNKVAIRFVRPLVLPAEVTVFTLNEEVYMGLAHGAPAVAVGSFETNARQVIAPNS